MVSRRTLIIGAAAAAIPGLGYAATTLFARDGGPGRGALTGVRSAAADTASPAEIQPDDRILGDPDAPVTIIEYSSLTCPHCARFHSDTLPEVKEKWIEPGRARLVYRHYPLDQTALRAALFTNCFEGNRFFGVLEILFDTQNDWARAENPMDKLAQVATMAGLSQDRFEQCLNDEAEADRIIEKQLAARDVFDVQSTPTFLIHGEKVVGAQPYENFAEVLRAAE